MSKILLRDRPNPIEEVEICSAGNVLCQPNNSVDNCYSVYYDKTNTVGYACTRKLNHKGLHVACSLMSHNLKKWK